MKAAVLAAPRPQLGGKHVSYICSQAPIWGPAARDPHLSRQTDARCQLEVLGNQGSRK